MSIMTRHNERRTSVFSEVREAARDELLMAVAGATGIVSVATAIAWTVVATA